MKAPEIGARSHGWTLTRWEVTHRGLVNMTVELGALVEHFDACHFGDGPDADPMAWAAEQAAKRQAFKPKVIEEAR